MVNINNNLVLWTPRRFITAIIDLRGFPQNYTVINNDMGDNEKINDISEINFLNIYLRLSVRINVAGYRISFDCP